MSNTANNELTLKRYLVLNDAKELSGKIIMIFIDNGNTTTEVDSYFEKLASKFLGENNSSKKLVNMSTKILTEYVNLLNKLVVVKNVNGSPTEMLYPEGLERDMIINKYRNLVKTEIAENPYCLNMPSIEKAGLKTIMAWNKQVYNDIAEFNNNPDLDKFKNTYLLTDYAQEIYEQSITKECAKLDTEAKEEKSKIASDSKISGAQKALMIEDVYRDRLNGKVFAPKNLALDYMNSIRQGLNAKLQFTYKSKPALKK